MRKLDPNEYWEDADSVDRLELCRGCDDLIEVIETRRFKKDFMTPRDPPEKVMHVYCRAYGLHLQFIDRIETPGKHCRKFNNG
jgi:hypothetical protein